jgi:hypothetical protein
MVRTFWPGCTGMSEGQSISVSVHVRPIVLWRENQASCECSCVSSVWTLRLMVGGALAQERPHRSVAPMLRTANLWRETVEQMVAPVPAAELEWTASDRRHLGVERRAVSRGGRRSSDPNPPNLDIRALLAEMERLRGENECLRSAALTFGALAERLNLRVTNSLNVNLHPDRE